MKKDIDNEFETISSDDAANNKTERHPSIGDAPHMVTDKEMEAISESFRFIADTMKGFTKVFCDDDGMLIDLTDKKGREYDRNFLLNAQVRIDEALESTGNNLKEHCKAEFLPEDKETMVKLNKNFADTRYWVFGSCFLGAAFLIAGLAFCIYSANKVSEMEKKCSEQATMAAFGNYCSKLSPNTYQSWQNGMTDRQDSVKSDRATQSVNIKK